MLHVARQKVHRVPPIKFTVEALQLDADDLVVCGRCCESDFGIGDVFSALEWVRFERDPVSGCFVPVASSVVTEVSLRVEEIGFYGRRIDRLSAGSTAGIKFSGEGLDHVKRIERTRGVVWSLVGDRSA